MSSTRDIGTTGEIWAVDYLQNQGLNIITRNYRTRFGEIDIIAKDKEILVFVEVKRKTQDFFGEPYEMVGKKKASKLIRMAEYYLMDEKIDSEPDWRIDVISIDSKCRVKWIRSAVHL